MQKARLSYLIFVILLTACIPGGMTFSPERAAIQDLIENQNARADSIRIRQVLPWRDGSIVLVSYLSDQENEEWNCEAVYEVARDTTGWHISGAGSGCSSEPNTGPITFGSGTHGNPPDEFSYTYGLVNLDDATWAEITWEDGVSQGISLVNDSFIVLRNGNFPNLAQVQILNAAEKVIYNSEE